MDFLIRHETAAYMRLRLQRGRFTAHEAEVLEYALSGLKGISGVRLYPSSGGISFSYEGGPGNREIILRKLRDMQFENVKLLARGIEDTIDAEEIARRKLSPEIKDRLRRKVLVETAADILMPMPLQVGYHLYQLVTLKNL
ncbi:MAG: hypothetical protein Q4D81_05660 [Eubacteriales bacterium]|nr:hypothetical protein [Eubacteriales bacterium]